MDLGKFKSIALRKKWPNEASDFTPWLANNMEALSEEIGIELEIESTEVAVGPYSADILAKDAGTGSYVVIENQLEKTNHDHLGKSIMYVAVRQAVKIKNHEELSENRKFQYNFWIKLRESLIASKKIPSVQTPRPQYWFDVSLGKANIHISNTCNTEQNIVGVRIYISNRISESMFPFLESRKEEIESKIGQKLEWNPNPENRDKVIVLSHSTDFSVDSKVDEAIKWLTEYTIKFREIFGSILRDYK